MADFKIEVVHHPQYPLPELGHLLNKRRRWAALKLDGGAVETRRICIEPGQSTCDVLKDNINARTGWQAKFAP